MEHAISYEELTLLRAGCAVVPKKKYVESRKATPGTNIVQKVPLHAEVTKSCDIGKPVVLSVPDSPESEAYQELARNVIQFLSHQPCNND